MDIKTGFFYLFGFLLLFSGFRVITARNPVHAALFLVLSFFQASGLWLLLQAEFLAITLVLVYVGAVMVLFLFVVMMLDIKIDRLQQGFWKQLPLMSIIGVVIALEMIAVIWAGVQMSEENIAPALPGVISGKGNTYDLGRLLYSDYILPLEVAAVILLVGMIAAIALTLRNRKDSKYWSAGEQVRIKSKDRVAVFKVSSVKPIVEAAAQAAAETQPQEQKS